MLHGIYAKNFFFFFFSRWSNFNLCRVVDSVKCRKC